MVPSLSIVIPAKNESASIGEIVRELRATLPGAEILVVDDGSVDATGTRASEAGARVIRHPASLGNGAAVKAGARNAGGELLVFMDGDGQHQPQDIPALLAELARGYDLVVGCRSSSAHASGFRRLANLIYNRLASWLTEQRIPDLTSGFRAVRTQRFREILALLPNGFSYPTTSTMAFLRAGHRVAFVPINVRQRHKDSKSHIRVFQDGARFLLIIFKIGTLYSPLKLFFPVSLLLFLYGCGYYAYTFMSSGRFTNFGALLFMASVLVFLIGLVSEQITTLIYLTIARSARSDEDR